MNTTPKVLTLVLKHAPYDVMVTGEKKYEYRQPTEWIKKRLYNKDGTERHYDLIKFTRGYNAQPSFIAKYEGFTVAEENICKEYSNGLIVGVCEYDYIIQVGEIISVL